MRFLMLMLPLALTFAAGLLVGRFEPNTSQNRVLARCQRDFNTLGEVTKAIDAQANEAIADLKACHDTLYQVSNAYNKGHCTFERKR